MPLRSGLAATLQVNGAGDRSRRRLFLALLFRDNSYVPQPLTRRRPLLPRACLVGIVVGAIVALAGASWSTLRPGRLVYTPEQAQEYQDAYAAASGHPPRGEAPASPATDDRDVLVAQARERFERAQAELDSARFVQNQLGKWLVGVGLVIMVVFGIVYATSRGPAD